MGRFGPGRRVRLVHAVAASHDQPVPGSLDISYYSGDTATIAYLESRGARLRVRPNEDLLRFRWPLVGATLPDAPLPAGFSIRTMENPADWPDRVAIHRDVWAPSRFSPEAYALVRESPIYRPDLDLVTVAPDGCFTSYALVWYDPVSRIGEFEPVGARAAYRGRGLGRAVVLEGLRRLQALGAREALVYTYERTPPAVALYRSAGFTIVGTYHFASLPLPPGA